MTQRVHGDIVHAFESESADAQEYLHYVAGGLPIDVHVGWVYQSGGGLGRLIRQTKQSPHSTIPDRTVDKLAELTAPLAARIAKSVDKRPGPIHILSCASGSSLNRILIRLMAGQLERLCCQVASTSELRKQPLATPLKSILDWDQRRLAAAPTCPNSLPAGMNGTTVIVDDVLASGTTITNLANSLSCDKVIVGVLSADLPGYVQRRGKLWQSVT